MTSIFSIFNNSKLEINGKTFDCDSQPDDKGRGSNVRLVFFEPDFEVHEDMPVVLNGKNYSIIEALNWDSHCQMYIKLTENLV